MSLGADHCTRVETRPGAQADSGRDGRTDDAPAGRRWPPLLVGSIFYRRSPTGARTVAAFVWLLFIVFPLLNAIGKHGSLVKHGLVIGGAALFVTVYVTMVLTWRRHERTRVPLLLFAVLLAVSVGLTLSQASGWGFMFTYCAACAGLVAPEGTGLYLVALCSALAGATSAVAGADGGTVLGFVASSAGIGLLMLVMSDLRLRNEQLSEARAELARLAVAQERERFARDLHDLLGHSLSVITLKAELAGRMLNDHPDAAAREVGEVERVARTALSEVREAVSGYHQPTLEGELAGARMALAAAGIQADVQEAHVPLDPALEAVLAWTVREGATNVIRHSAARHCTLRVTASLTDAGVEVIDDGAGAAVSANGVGATVSANGVGAAVSAGSVGTKVSPDGVDITVPADGVGTEVSADSVGTEVSADDVGTAVSADDVGTEVSADDVGTEVSADSVRTKVSADSAGAKVPADGGHGIAGLAERARLVNGTLEAGALAGGGYRLAVTVPLSHA